MVAGMILFFSILGKAEYGKKEYQEREFAVARILVSGATGLVGSALVAALRQRGDTVFTLVRHSQSLAADTFYWNPDTFFFPEGLLSEIDAVIHLGGAPIADGRWTSQRKQVLIDSRIRSTRLLVDALLRDNAVSTRVLMASAIGYYGPLVSSVTDEWGVPGAGFLSDLCVAWEHESAVLAVSGISSANLRFGMILSPTGGALSKMLPAFRFGFGAVLGDGSQWMSWISLYDAVSAILFLIDHPDVTGAVNVTTPHPVTNQVFSETLAEALYDARLPNSAFFPLWRQVPLRIPEGALRILLGDMADDVLLANQKVVPSRLAAAGFHWRDGHIGPALRQLLV
jgi:uncharacterized protein